MEDDYPGFHVMLGLRAVFSKEADDAYDDGWTCLCPESWASHVEVNLTRSCA